MNGLRLVYLGLTLAGFWLAALDMGWAGALGQADPSGVVAGLALALFVSAETLVRRDYWTFAVIPVILWGGVPVALPLYLFLRSRPLD